MKEYQTWKCELEYVRALGIVGSMRKKGVTNQLVRSVLQTVREANPKIKIKVLQMSDLKIEPCRGCYDACSRKPYECVIENDDLQKVLEDMRSSQAIVIGSPMYFKIPSRLTAFMERLACLAYFYERKGFEQPHPLNQKPCGLVAASGGDDPRPILEHLLAFALSLKMTPIFLKSYPYYGVGAKGSIEADDDLRPTENARALGQLLARAIEEDARVHSRT